MRAVFFFTAVQVFISVPVVGCGTDERAQTSDAGGLGDAELGDAASAEEDRGPGQPDSPLDASVRVDAASDASGTDAAHDSWTLADAVEDGLTADASTPCSLEGGNASTDGTRRALFEWFSPSLEDNLISADPAWKGCTPGVDSRAPDYVFVRNAGWVFAAERPRPEGTIPLFTWYSSDRYDTFTTSNPIWTGAQGVMKEGYEFVRIEGYVYPPSYDVQPIDRIPIYAWWSDVRWENYTTTDPNWAGSPGAVKEIYAFSRLEGFALVDGTSP